MGHFSTQEGVLAKRLVSGVSCAAHEPSSSSCLCPALARKVRGPRWLSLPCAAVCLCPRNAPHDVGDCFQLVFILDCQQDDVVKWLDVLVDCQSWGCDQVLEQFLSGVFADCLGKPVVC